jgi:hypothetical protein
MIGQQSIFSDILPTLQKPKAEGIGRSKVLITQRNTKLIYRYYYYVKLQPHRLDYSYIIDTISTEMDLSDYRTIIILQQNHAELKTILAQELTKKELAKKYPFLSWE